MRAVRAGEAKLRRRMTIVVLIAGPVPGVGARGFSLLTFLLILISFQKVFDIFCYPELVFL